jgi:hypothetical protein
MPRTAANFHHFIRVVDALPRVVAAINTPDAVAGQLNTMSVVRRLCRYAGESESARNLFETLPATTLEEVHGRWRP